MGEKVRCEICNRDFKDADSLEQHNMAKHPVVEKRKFNSRKIGNWVIFILIVAGVFSFILWTVMGAIKESSSCKTDPVTEINIGGHNNVKLHIHADLQIIIDGKEEFIPANIGISTGVMRPLHTHDTDGEIHIEGPCARNFRLGEFFDVWGRNFNSKCIFDKCDDLGVLKMKINGIESNEFENYIMKDHDNILIEYKRLDVLK